jgi:hypothetical protein
MARFLLSLALMRTSLFFGALATLAVIGCGGSGGGSGAGNTGNTGGNGGNGGTGGGGTITFSDGSFTQGWQEVAAITDKFATGAATTVGSGGNPGSFFQITLNQTGDRALFLIDRPDFLYQPATQGAIEQIEFGDSIIDLSNSSTGQTAGLLLVQSGRYYTAGQVVINAGNWVNNDAYTDLQPGSFEEIDSDTTYNLNSHPDFSATAAPITFGLCFAALAAQPKTETGNDNYFVQIVSAKK